MHEKDIQFLDDLILFYKISVERGKFTGFYVMMKLMKKNLALTSLASLAILVGCSLGTPVQDPSNVPGEVTLNHVKETDSPTKFVFSIQPFEGWKYSDEVIRVSPVISIIFRTESPEKIGDKKINVIAYVTPIGNDTSEKMFGQAMTQAVTLDKRFKFLHKANIVINDHPGTFLFYSDEASQTVVSQVHIGVGGKGFVVSCKGDNNKQINVGEICRNVLNTFSIDEQPIITGRNHNF